ncbi:MAG: type II secretion system F family protein [Proteobacteria bacterium]|nr:type II secretion system F family protein [Pseudomonadota bacterium]
MAQTPPGTIIPNLATVDYQAPSGLPETVISNLVEIVTVVPRIASILDLTRVLPGAPGVVEAIGPASCNLSGTGFVALPDPLLTGGISIDPNQPQTVVDALSYHAGEAVFVRVGDADQNLDPLLRETLSVILQGSPGGDSEQILLTETAADSGVFAGYLQSTTGIPVAGDCVLQLTAGGQVFGDYTDPADAADQSGDNVGVDPSSRVFESQLGQPVDGASITLLDAASGLPALVFGDDGVSIFPSTIVAGGTATDSGGTSYNFASGEYRFPVVSPGNYRIQVIPPAGFAAPSTRTIAELQLLPGAPFALGPGSFGNPLASGPEPGFAVDIPLDLLSNELFLQKTTGNGVAAIGDFVQYQLLLENTSALGDLAGTVITDRLPAGFRYQPGSLTIGGIAAADPAIGADGRRMTIDIGALPAGYFFPNLMLTSQVQSRQQAFTTSFPDALDLLVICVEAGLSMEAAFHRVTDELAENAPVLAQEFGLTTAELAYLGDRGKALENLALRTGLDTVKSFTTSLIQSEKYGTPLATALRVISQENREKRMAKVEEKAAALGAKMTVPMIAFFLPVIFIVVIGPAVIQVMAM